MVTAAEAPPSVEPLATSVSSLVVTPSFSGVSMTFTTSPAVCARLFIGPSLGTYTTCTTGYDSTYPGVSHTLIGWGLAPATLYHYYLQFYDQNLAALDATTDATFTTAAAPAAAPAPTFVHTSPLQFTPDNTYDIGASGATRPRSVYAASGIYVAMNTAAQGPALWGGAGVPAAGLGANGDFFLRSDTPATSLQRIYIKSAGAWVGVV